MLCRSNTWEDENILSEIILFLPSEHCLTLHKSFDFGKRGKLEIIYYLVARIAIGLREREGRRDVVLQEVADCNLQHGKCWNLALSQGLS